MGSWHSDIHRDDHSSPLLSPSSYAIGGKGAICGAGDDKCEWYEIRTQPITEETTERDWYSVWKDDDGDYFITDVSKGAAPHTDSFFTYFIGPYASKELAENDIPFITGMVDDDLWSTPQ